MAVYLSPVGGAGAQFFDSSGAPLSGGKLYTYAAGTTTPQTTYTTSTGSIAHANPIVLNSAGRVSAGGEIWLTSAAYKFVLTTSADALLATWDNVRGINAFAVQTLTGTGSQTIFTLSGATVQNIFINGVYQNKSTYSVTGSTLTFSEAPPLTSKIEIQLS